MVKNWKDVTVTAVGEGGGEVVAGVVDAGGGAAALVMGWLPSGQVMPCAGRA